MDEKERVKDNLTIIDGSSLIYSACYNVSTKEDKTDNFNEYKQTLTYYIESILKDTNADAYIIYGDQSTSYRKNLFDSFKANRITRPYLKFMFDLREYANKHLNFFNHKDLEADDLCLLTKNQFKDKYEVTIASKDSDLRQDVGKFFNYGIYRTTDYKIEDAFEELDIVQATINLWKAVLIKGHNNKFDYLDGCGEVCATNYLSNWKLTQYPYAVLQAFIYGISKEHGVKRNISGYGLNGGIDKFNKSFKQTYLFRYFSELESLGIELIFPEFSINLKNKPLW